MRFALVSSSLAALVGLAAGAAVEARSNESALVSRAENILYMCQGVNMATPCHYWALEESQYGECIDLPPHMDNLTKSFMHNKADARCTLYMEPGCVTGQGLWSMDSYKGYDYFPQLPRNFFQTISSVRCVLV